MLRTLFSWLLATALFGLTGCAVCSAPDDFNYAARGGGCCEVSDPCYRCGSAFGPRVEIAHSRIVNDPVAKELPLPGPEE